MNSGNNGSSIDDRENKQKPTWQKKEDDLIQYADDFVRRFHNREYLVTSEARKILFDSMSYNPDYGKSSLSEILADMIKSYEFGTDPKYRYNDALRLKSWVITAFIHSVIIENKDNLHTKLEEKEEEIATLRAEKSKLEKDRNTTYEENAKLAYKLAEAIGKIAVLEEKFNKMFPKEGDKYGV